jgi:hypothetical protein
MAVLLPNATGAAENNLILPHAPAKTKGQLHCDN